MKASIKLREDELKPPLLRAKVPISIFNLPFAASIAAGDPSDLSFHLLTSFSSLPSLKLSYHPNPNPSPFTLTLKSGAGRFGSPANSPLHISFRLSPNPNPSFSIHFKPQLGHFSLSKSAISSSSSSSAPDPDHPKENGGGVHRPIPVVCPPERIGIEELIRGGVGVRVRTSVPLGPRAGLKVRWAVKIPPAVTGSPGVFRRLPYLSMDKISIERVEEDEEEEEEERRGVKEWSEKDLEGMRGMCFWMGKEVEELKKESGEIKEGVEGVKKKFLVVNEIQERERIKNAGNYRGSFGAAGRRA